MVRQLQIDHATRAVTKLKGSTPIGSDVVTSIVQAFSIHHAASFAKLPRACRHHVLACLMQDTAGLRFGHFIYRSYTNADLSWNQLGATLLSNWQRYPGKSAAAITFRFRPKWQCFSYPAKNSVNITAAKLLQWHVRTLQPNDLLFEPLVGRKPDRGDRQRWLRLVCKTCYVISPRTANAFTKHHTAFLSWRYGGGYAHGRSITRTGRSTRALALKKGSQTIRRKMYLGHNVPA